MGDQWGRPRAVGIERALRARAMPPRDWMPASRSSASTGAKSTARSWALFFRTAIELRYVLDPADVNGPDYPSETFRVLKTNEMRRYGEYRTQRLILSAWDIQEGASTVSRAHELGGRR